MPRRPVSGPEQLSRREREIVYAIFALGNRATAQEIRARLTCPPGYSAVRAMLGRLEAKGHVRHTENGSRYVYRAMTSRESAQKVAFQHYLDTFFRGLRGQCLVTLLRQGAWADSELDALIAEIQRVKEEGPRRASRRSQALVK